MTNEKNFESFNYILGQLQCGYVDLSWHDENELKIVKQAIEKQMPQKVINKGRFYGYACYCPICSEIVTNKRSEYCNKCGQALDWSEEL